ncbi:MAG: ABC transporter permease [Spirochaetaceae bacterium]|jgi:ribose/xylose/arabinose/galactoside ABC-type transport system permease subunit|nr:ABC transporter permease [Spirochaetaceae bacterium]
MKLNKIRNKNIGSFTEAGILVILLVFCVIISFVNPVFISGANLSNLLRTTSYIIIVACLTTIVMISGGLDLSVGSQIGLGGILVSTLMVHGIPIILAIILTLAANSIIGLLNGVIVVKRKLPPMIATMGTMYIARGICNVITRGMPVYPLPPAFGMLGNGTFLRITYSAYIAVAVALVMDYVLRNTTYGRSIYAIGGNQDAARLSGIAVDRIKMSAYVFSSLSATFVGIIMTSRIESGQVTLGTGREMTIIAAVVIGGTSTLGGSGTILGTVIGGLLMSVVENSMVLMRISVYWQSVVIGIIMIVAVLIDVFRKERAGMKV